MCHFEFLELNICFRIKKFSLPLNGTPIDYNILKYSAELYTGLPIFPGENEHEQMACIMEILTLPPGGLLKSTNEFRGQHFLPG